MENELTVVIQSALLLQRLDMESLPSIVFVPRAAAAAVAVDVLRKSDQPGGKEGGPWSRRGWETVDSGTKKWRPPMHPHITARPSS